MFQVKTKARFLSHGAKTKGVLYLLLPSAALFGALISGLYFALCAVYGAKTVFEGWIIADLLESDSAENTVKYFFFISFVLFLTFFSSLRFTGRAYFYYKTDKNQSRPKSFISFKTAGKSAWSEVYLFSIKSAYMTLFLLPGIISLGALYFTAYKEGLSRLILYSGTAAVLLQLLSAIASAFVFFGRYYMTEYLLYLNPLMSVREAVLSSSMLMRGKLLKTALFRIQTIPWRISELFIPAFPFSFSYLSFLRAVMCEKIFAEDKTKVNSPAVSFYIDKKSKFFEEPEIFGKI